MKKCSFHLFIFIFFKFRILCFFADVSKLFVNSSDFSSVSYQSRGSFSGYHVEINDLLHYNRYDHVNERQRNGHQNNTIQKVHSRINIRLLRNMQTLCNT